MRPRAGRKGHAVWAATLLAVSIAIPIASNADQADDAKLAVARQAAGALAARLKQNLSDALKDGGPVNAIAACQLIAPEGARAVSQEFSLSIRRTALRVRNPSNAPDAFERSVLEDFSKAIAAGADAATLERAAWVEDGGVRTLRFMKPIPMAEKPCVVCHGSAIAPEVQDKIKALYPEDKATGFKPGELRGAFSISIPAAK